MHGSSCSQLRVGVLATSGYSAYSVCTGGWACHGIPRNSQTQLPHHTRHVLVVITQPCYWLEQAHCGARGGGVGPRMCTSGYTFVHISVAAPNHAKLQNRLTFSCECCTVHDWAKCDGGSSNLRNFPQSLGQDMQWICRCVHWPRSTSQPRHQTLNQTLKSWC